MPDEVLTIKEVAALLKLAEKTVYAMAQAGEIPARFGGSGASSVPSSTSGSTRSRAVALWMARRASPASVEDVMATRDTRNKKRGRPPKVAMSEAAPPVNEDRAKKASTKNGSTSDAVVGFEEKLWQMADKLRNNMDAAEYKHVVLGLIFLKYISDAFEEKRAALTADKKSGADPEDPDEYRADNIYWVPKEARWTHLQGNAKQATIGKLIDDAMVALEAQNPTLKGVLQKDYGRPGLDKTRLGELIDLVGTIGLGDRENRARDVLGRVYEMLAPYKGRVFDPACGSGGMFISSEKFVEAHGGRVGDISIYGQESNHTTWRLAKLNLAIRGIDANIVHGLPSLFVFNELLVISDGLEARIGTLSSNKERFLPWRTIEGEARALDATISASRPQGDRDQSAINKLKSNQLGMPHLDIVGTAVATEFIICASKDTHIEQVRAKLGGAGLEAIDGGDTNVAATVAPRPAQPQPRQGGFQQQRGGQHQGGGGQQRSRAPHGRQAGPASNAQPLPGKPYGFVALPKELKTSAPVWHDGTSSNGRLSGEVRFEIETLTPLLVGWERGVVATNYLNESELAQLSRLVNAYLDVAESMALRKIPMTMQDWETRLIRFLDAADHAVLSDAGKVTAEIAKAHAESEFEKYRIVQDQLFESDFDRVLAETKRLSEGTTKDRPGKGEKP